MYIFDRGTELGVINSDGGLREGPAGTTVSKEALRKAIFLVTDREGRAFLAARHCIIEEFLSTRKTVPPPKIGHVYNLPASEERLITLSIQASCRKFTSSEINCTIISLECFSVKNICLTRKGDISFCLCFHTF